MVALAQERSAEIVDDVIHAVKCSNSANTLPQELINFELVLRAMGSLLTADQCLRLGGMARIQKILDQDNEPSVRTKASRKYIHARPAQIRADWMLYWPRA